MKTSKLFALIIAIAAGLAVLAGSIAAPILCRPFYYVQIKALDLEARTGYSEEVIRTAYDEVLDFCVLGAPFGTGELTWSESGQSHFADAARLFRLDFALGIAAGIALLICLGLRARGLRPHRFLGRSPGFWAGSVLAIIFVVLAVLAAADFDRAFVVFHTLFFPGKDNWIFDPAEDAIINILPQEFFRNCAILILAILAAGCAAFIAFGLNEQKGRERPGQTRKIFRTNV